MLMCHPLWQLKCWHLLLAVRTLISLSSVFIEYFCGEHGEWSLIERRQNMFAESREERGKTIYFSSLFWNFPLYFYDAILKMLNSVFLLMDEYLSWLNQMYGMLCLSQYKSCVLSLCSFCCVSPFFILCWLWFFHILLFFCKPL